MIFRRIIHLAVLLFPLYTYGQNEFTIQYRTCTNCDGQLENDNIQFQYGDVQDIQTSHISSDYGKRNHARAWHYGVDYNLEPQDPDAGDHVLAIVGGTVERISGGTGNYKHIRIDADGDEPDFGYGHIFRDGSAIGGMRSGNFVLKELDDDDDIFAIIFFPTTGQPVAISQVDGATVTYSGYPYTTTNRVTQGQSIAPYGRSGGSNVHLHLYRLLDVTGSINSADNTKDPLEVVDHGEPDYNIRIEPDDLIVNYPGSLRSSIKVEAEMRTPGLSTDDPASIPPTWHNYDNVAMNIDEVSLRIKKAIDEDSQYQEIEGVNFQSKIILGARLNVDRYPNNNVVDIADFNQNGSATSIGIVPWAYRDPIDGVPQGLPQDDFYFSDIYLRIHKDHVIGESGSFAHINEVAKYPDGSYNLRMQVTTVRDVNFTADHSELLNIDNFKPYIKKLEVWNSQFGDSYFKGQTGEWVWQNDQLDYVEDLTSQTVPGEHVRIIFTGTEPFFLAPSDADPNVQYEPTLTLNGVEYTDFGISDDNLEVTFDIPPSVTNTLDGAYTLTIDAYDINLNQITGFQSSDIFITSDELPHRTGENTWSGTLISQTDTKHLLRVGGNTCGAQRDVQGRLESCPLVADFTFEAEQGNYQTIVFADQSSPSDQIDTWDWDFGDGSAESNASGSVIHSYSSDGEYVVSLTVHREDETDTYDATISVFSQLSAAFTVSSEQGPAPFTVDFNSSGSTGSISQRTWTIQPDNGYTFTSGDQNDTSPAIRFDNAGLYVVSLEVTDGISSHRSSQDIIAEGAEPIANFEWDAPITAGGDGVFRDISFYACLGGTAHATWDFGDGSSPVNSLGGSITHVFSSSGNYEVTFSLTNNCGQTDEVTKTVTVDEYAPSITPLFSGPALIERGSTVSFLDYSSPQENIIGWAWYFELPENHGTQRPTADPDEVYGQAISSVSHTFNQLGRFKVRLYTSDNVNFEGPYYEQVVEVIAESPHIHEDHELTRSESSFIDLALYGDEIAAIEECQLVSCSLNYDTPAHIQLFQFDASGSWMSTAKIESSFPLGEGFLRAEQIAFDGQMIVVESQDDLFIIEKTGATWDNPTITKRSFSSTGVRIEDIYIDNGIIFIALIDLNDPSGVYSVHELNKQAGEWPNEPPRIIEFDGQFLNNSLFIHLMKIIVKNDLMALQTKDYVQVLRHENSNWLEQFHYWESDPYQMTDIAFDGDNLITGAYESNVEGDGIMRLWKRPASGWANHDRTFQTLRGSIPTSGLGLRVEMTHDKIYGFAPREPRETNPLIDGRGPLIYAFEKDFITGTGVQNEFTKLIPETGHFSTFLELSSHRGTLVAFDQRINTVQHSKIWIFQDESCLTDNNVTSLTVSTGQQETIAGRNIDMDGVVAVTNNGSLDINPSEKLHIKSIFHAQRGSRVHIVGKACEE